MFAVTQTTMISTLFSTMNEWRKYEHINQRTHDKQQLNSIRLQYLAIEQEFVELFCPLEAIQWACVCSVFN
jgi:hypothetical protein